MHRDDPHRRLAESVGEVLREADLTGSVGAITCPTLGIAGAADGSTPPAFVAATVERIAGARFAVIADTGHIPCVEQPRALAERILEFLGSSGLSDGRS